MSLFDALKEKDNLFGLPLLQAGLTILANNRGNTAGAPAILSGFNAGLSSYQTMDKRARIRKFAEEMKNPPPEVKKDPPPTPSSWFQPAVPPRRNFTPVPQQPNSMLPQQEQNFTPVPQEMQSDQPQLAGNYKPEIQEIRHPNAVDYQPPQGTANVYGGQAEREMLKQLILANMDETNFPQLLGLYQKTQPSYKQDSFIIKGAGGVPQRVLVNSNGESQVLPYNEFGEAKQADTGSHLYYIDPHTGEPRAIYKKGVSPDKGLQANTSMAIANENIASRERIAQEQATNKPKKIDQKTKERIALFNELGREFKNMRALFEGGYKGLSAGENLLINPPFQAMSPYTRGFASANGQIMNNIIENIKIVLTKIKNTGTPSNLDLKKIENTLTLLANDSPEVKEHVLNRIDLFIEEILNSVQDEESAAGNYAKERNGYSQQNNGSSSSNQNASSLRFNPKDYR